MIILMLDDEYHLGLVMTCQFPMKWWGNWYQSGLGDVIITGSHISSKGHCVEHHLRSDFFVVENRSGYIAQRTSWKHRFVLLSFVRLLKSHYWKMYTCFFSNRIWPLRCSFSLKILMECDLSPQPPVWNGATPWRLGILSNRPYGSN